MIKDSRGIFVTFALLATSVVGFAMLFGNALVMTASEGALRIDSSGSASLAWTRIRATSIVSAFLWGSIVLVSIVLALSK